MLTGPATERRAQRVPSPAGRTLPCVPQRTNLFQEVVAIVYENLAGDASKEECAMLPNRLTGELREVDIVLRATMAGHETVIAIEAAGRARRATVDWVEQMIGKHKNLPTDKLVLVSKAGFSKQARTLAAAEQMATVTPGDAADADLAQEVVNALPSLWPKTVTLGPDSATVWVSRPDGTEVWFKAPADLDLVYEDGAPGFDLQSFYQNTYRANWRRAVEQIGLADVTEDAESFFVFQIGPPVEVRVDGQPCSLFARWTEYDPPELHRVEKIVLHGKAEIKVSEIQLIRKRLGEIDVRYAYGEGIIGSQRALAVFTEGEDGDKLTIRVRDD
jgi:hypothetical protein